MKSVLHISVFCEISNSKFSQLWNKEIRPSIFLYKFVFSKKTGRKPTPEPLLHLINVIGNLYSSHSLAQPMNYPVIGLSRLDLLRQ